MSSFLSHPNITSDPDFSLAVVTPLSGGRRSSTSRHPPTHTHSSLGFQFPKKADVVRWGYSTELSLGMPLSGNLMETTNTSLNSPVCYSFP